MNTIRTALATLACAAAAASAQQPRVLVFTKTTGYRHDSIPAAVAAVQTLAQQNCFQAVHTEDAGQFNPANLATFDAVIFLLTTGEVLDAAQEQAFEQWYRAGGGWVGVHSASDTEYTWPFYGQLLGAYVLSHPNAQTASVIVENAAHPSTAHLPSPWVRFDEWYDFQSNPRPTVTVLLRLDESTYTGGQMGQDHPIAWFHQPEGGRAWYSALGHTTESYSDPHFLRHLLGGVLWAAGHPGCACYADCDGDGQLTLADFGCFQTRFATASPYADCDGDGSLTLADFGCFQTRYAQGCN